MFESDDWDLDQDFFTDLDDKNVTFCSQASNQEIVHKKRKVDVSQDPLFSSNNDLNWCENETVNKGLIKNDVNKASRKNLVLGMFNKNVSNTNASENLVTNSKKLPDSTLLEVNHDRPSCSGSSSLPRKNLVLDILKQKNVQNKSIEINAKKSVSPKTELKTDGRSRINEQQNSILLNYQTKVQTAINNFQQKSSTNNDSSKLSSSKNSRKLLLCNILKKRAKDNAELRNDESVLKVQQAQSNIKTLERKFPGPAGLLPDNIENDLPPVSYLNGLEEKEMTKDISDSKMSEFCSQNTKTMFTEGPWQLMLNDLSEDFLKGHEIASIKQMAKANGCSSMKVEFMVGILEHIDLSHDNPPIVLKDFTDSIQGILHKDIPLKYPGLIEPNVVMFFHDVGLLKTSASLISNKYHILISPSNLLAIYTNAGKIERTEYMESILRDASDEETEKDKRSSKATNCKSKTNGSNVKVSNLKQNREKIDKSDSSFDTSLSKALECMNESLNFDIPDDISFAVSSDGITNTQNQKNFSNSASKNVVQGNKPRTPKKFCEKSKENVQNDSRQRSETLLKSLKKFSANVTDKKKLSHKSEMDVERSVSINSYSEKVERETLNNISFEEMDVDESDVNMSREKAESVVKKLYTTCNDKTESAQVDNVEGKNRLSIRSKLLQFKSADTSTPPETSESATSGDSKRSDENSKNENPFSSTLCNAENDSEDEMLSQLDIDTIFSNYEN